jgi:hypothetical protein
MAKTTDRPVKAPSAADDGSAHGAEAPLAEGVA